MIRDVQHHIEQIVTSWPGMSATTHRHGGREFNLGTREIGHVHGDYMVDIPFPVKVRKELVEAGKAELHHLLPESGWVSYYIRKEEDIAGAIELLEKSYQLALEQQRKQGETSKV
ncbi:MAG: luciferase family protein [Trueperaceae bacterium]